MHNPARFRLDFIKENTFNRIWSIRMTRAKVISVSVLIGASGLALLWAVFAFTPLRQLLPGALRGDLRSQYVATALRLDSLETAARQHDAYMKSMLSAINGPEIETEDAAKASSTKGTAEIPDSLLASSEAERSFVRRYEEEERFNLSVLAPIAAEGMIFASPAPTISAISKLTGSIEIKTTFNGAVTAVYRGTVIETHTDDNGLTDITVQHPNDFVSIYSGLAEAYAGKGSKISPGQRLGHAGANGSFRFELWHKGTALDPSDYIPAP